MLVVLCSFQNILVEVGFQDGVPIDEAFFRKHISGRHNPEIAGKRVRSAGHGWQRLVSTDLVPQLRSPCLGCVLVRAQPQQAVWCIAGQPGCYACNWHSPCLFMPVRATSTDSAAIAGGAQLLCMQLAWPAHGAAVAPAADGALQPRIQCHPRLFQPLQLT